MKTFIDLNLGDGEPRLEFTGERFCPDVRGGIRYEHIHRYIYAERLVSGKAVLDVACGEGYGSHLLSTRAHSVLGIDVDPSTIAHAVRRYATDRIRFVAGSIEHLPLGDASIDIAICFETIEHVTDQLGSVAELRRVLKPQGLLLISTPNAEANDGAWHTGNPYHTHEMSQTEFVAMLELHFPQVRLLTQRSIHGSIILPVETPSTTGGHTASALSSSTFTSEDEIDASYLIAAASAVDTPDAVASLYDDSNELDRERDEFRYAVSRMHALEEELDQERAKAVTLETQYGADLESACARVAALEAQVKSSLEVLTGREQTLKKLTTANDILKIQIEHLRTKLKGIGA